MCPLSGIWPLVPGAACLLFPKPYSQSILLLLLGSGGAETSALTVTATGLYISHHFLYPPPKFSCREVLWLLSGVKPGQGGTETKAK